MIISPALKYVYVAIPRTGSKSMAQWLVDHYQGEWHGQHHEWKVPQDYRDYLVFTIVRNPYEVQASGWFFQPVIRSLDQPPKPATYAEQVRIWRASTPSNDQPYLQKHFIEWAGVTQILFFEQLPDCLTELPFVDPDYVPPFPHLNAGGYRPPGTFFDIMQPEDEALVWEGAREDFDFLGYQRYHPGLSTAALNHPLRRAQR